MMFGIKARNQVLSIRDSQPMETMSESQYKQRLTETKAHPCSESMAFHLFRGQICRDSDTNLNKKYANFDDQP